jgi:hypothetical protein
MRKLRPFFTALFVVGMLLTAAGACAREPGRWATGAPMPSERSEVAAAEVGGKIYVVCQSAPNNQPASASNIQPFFWL